MTAASEPAIRKKATPVCLWSASPIAVLPAKLIAVLGLEVGDTLRGRSCLSQQAEEDGLSLPEGRRRRLAGGLEKLIGEYVVLLEAIST